MPPAIFWHASAETSKAGSNRKEGALYGFFFEPVVSRALSLVELFIFTVDFPRFFIVVPIVMLELRSHLCRPRSCKADPLKE